MINVNLRDAQPDRIILEVVDTFHFDTVQQALAFIGELDKLKKETFICGKYESCLDCKDDW